MYKHFLRDKAAATIQQRDWERAVKRAGRIADFISKPCPYCGTMMTLMDDVQVLTSETLDHIVPKCKGGTATVIVCQRCNRDKHHLSLSEWRAVLTVRRRIPHVFYYEWRALQMALIHATYLFSMVWI